MYIVNLTKIAKTHIFQHSPIWPEVAGIMIFHQKWVLWVYLRLLETIVHYKKPFHEDFHIFEKNRFFQVQNLAKKMKIANFTKNSSMGDKCIPLEHFVPQNPWKMRKSNFFFRFLQIASKWKEMIPDGFRSVPWTRNTLFPPQNTPATS